MPVRVTSPYQGVAGTALYEAVDRDGWLIAGPKAVIVGMTHGNEIVGEAVIARLEREAEKRVVGGQLLLVRNNLEAQALNRRNTPDGVDLNRLWDAESLTRIAGIPVSERNYEQRRVLEVAPLLRDADAILDLHSTSRPSPPFLVFRDDQAHADLARKLGIPWLVTGFFEGAILGGGTCAEVGLWPGESAPRIGYTFESGQHLDPANLDRAYDVSQRFLHQLGVWNSAPPVPAGLRPKVYEATARVRQSAAGREPWRFVGYAGGEVGSGRRAPPRALASFDEVEAGELVLRRGRTGTRRAQAPFTMLLPTPNADPGTDLYYIANQRPEPRATVRTHAEARNEAIGIERMLDLLDDDAFARGNSRVSFDARHVLDSCAEFIGRAVRLPADHPHRQVTVIGRGGIDGDESERRAGQRYRAAMRRALAEGVPVDRVQLMRGAPLSWFRVLTTRGMGHLVDRRNASLGGDERGMRLWLSTRQPPTVSVIVVGDLARALADGDFRHVRVGLVVEAATVEAEGTSAGVRLTRAGLFSARPEVLRATERLLEGLWEEHRWLVRRPPLADHPAIHPLLDEQLAIRPRGDPASLLGLRDALCRLQIGLWRDTLPFDGVQAIGDDEAIGPWLAEVLATTGILDAVGLKALLCQRDEYGLWNADPARLGALLADPEPFDVRRQVPQPRSSRLPEQPVFATDIDADNIERWIGWKRYVRDIPALADGRGTDLTLGFEDRVIAGGTRALLRRARELAAAQPGDVMLVIAGHGQHPDPNPPATPLPVSDTVDEHRLALFDPNLRILRIQHGQSTNMAWFKDVLGALAARPQGAQPVAVQWEAAQGASVNLAVVCVRDPEVLDRPWSLDGWNIVGVSLLLSQLRVPGRDHRVWLASEGDTANAELLTFARAHLEALLAQGGPRVATDAGAAHELLESVIIGQIGTWIERSRATAAHGAAIVPVETEARARFVAGQLGLADVSLARAIAACIDQTTPPAQAAREVWDAVPAWR